MAMSSPQRDANAISASVANKPPSAVVVVRKELPIGRQRLDRREERGELRRIVEIRPHVAELTVHLRERGGAEPPLPRAEIDPDQRRVAAFQHEQRRQHAPRIGHRRKRRHDQRQRRGDGVIETTIAPRRAHRHRVLADGDADAERPGRTPLRPRARYRRARRLRHGVRPGPSSWPRASHRRGLRHPPRRGW